MVRRRGIYLTLGSNKKGFIGDTITLIIFFMIIAIVIMGVYATISSVKSSFDSTSGISAQTKTMMTTAKDSYISLWDGIFGFLLITLSLAAVVSSFFIDTHPILLPFILIILGIYIFLSAAIANVYYTVEASSAFIGFAESFTIMHFVMSNLAYYAALMGIMITIALFAKANQ
jgi:hypothetical protein